MIKKSKFLKRNLLRRPYVVCSDRATLSCEVFSHKNLSRVAILRMMYFLGSQGYIELVLFGQIFHIAPYVLFLFVL